MKAMAVPDLGRLNLIGSSPKFTLAVAQLRRLAPVDATVLIEGETGTGKELAARALHYLGPRGSGPFVPVNCGALAENLLESELFGHKRGAFTDARSASEGLIAEAEGGTLFLDEVDSLSPKAQSALLRFLQDKQYRPVGGGALRQSNARVLVASNADLEQLALAHQFRQDLYYRLSVLRLRLPPLRERGDDAVELARVFLRRLAHQAGGGAPTQLHPDLEAYIRAYPWPGNVRELEHAIQRAFLMSDPGAPWLCLYREGAEAVGGGEMSEMDFKHAKARAIAEFERGYVQRLLSRTNGNITHAARIAGQDRSVFSKLVRKHKTTLSTPG